MLAPFAALVPVQEEQGGGPAAAPSNVSLFQYSGNLVGVQWVNGDATASTQIGKSTDMGTEPTNAEWTVSPGSTRLETGDTGVVGGISGTWYWCRHTKNGQHTAWVRSADAAT